MSKTYVIFLSDRPLTLEDELNVVLDFMGCADLSLYVQHEALPESVAARFNYV